MDTNRLETWTQDMTVGALIFFTLASVSWSLWIRRLTWHCRWQVAATLNVALQGIAVALMSPYASATVGHWLHALTGRWNLEDFIGHDAYIVAASAIVYNALGCLGDDHALASRFRLVVEYPATLCIPILLADFSMGDATRVYRADFFTLPTDGWLTIYWLLLCGMLIHLLTYSCRALAVLRRDPESRRVANIYFCSAISGIVACVVRTATALNPALQALERGVFVWVFACGCGAGFALTSAQNWRVRIRQMSRRSVDV